MPSLICLLRLLGDVVLGGVTVLVELVLTVVVAPVTAIIHQSQSDDETNGFACTCTCNTCTIDNINYKNISVTML